MEGTAEIGGGTAFGVIDIDAATRASKTAGHVSVVNTLGAILGIPQSVTQNDLVASAAGKPIRGGRGELPSGLTECVSPWDVFGHSSWQTSQSSGAYAKEGDTGVYGDMI